MNRSGFLRLMLGCVLSAAVASVITWRIARHSAPHKRHQISLVPGALGIQFFDQDTGELWMYGDPTKPAVRYGRLESFDKPLVTPEMIAQFERREAEAAEKPAETTPVKPVPHDDRPTVEKLNALPKNLWPAEGENSVKREARESWLKEHFQPGMDTFTGKINGIYNYSDGKIAIILKVEKVMVLDKETALTNPFTIYLTIER